MSRTSGRLTVALDVGIAAAIALATAATWRADETALSRSRGPFGWRGLLVSSAATAAIATAAFGLHWMGAATPISSQLRRTSSTSIPYYAEQWLGLPHVRVGQLLSLLFVLAYLSLLRDPGGAAATGSG